MRKVTGYSIDWVYSEPEEKGATMLLLTVGGCLVKGVWYGELGEYLVAWAPMPKRDKETEFKIKRIWRSRSGKTNPEVAKPQRGPSGPGHVPVQEQQGI